MMKITGANRTSGRYLSVSCRSLRVIGIASAALAVTACGGGGADGVNSTPAPAPLPSPTPSPTTFTSFSEAPRSATIAISGKSLEGSYNAIAGTYNGIGSFTRPQSGDLTTKITFDGSGDVTSAAITGTQSSVQFSTTDGSSGTNLAALNAPGLDLLQSANKQNILIAADEDYFGFNYQSFGIWMTGIGTNSGSYGVYTMGADTKGTSIPLSGQTSFSGAVGGIYVNPNGATYEVVGSAIYAVNFANRTVQMRTANSYAADIFSGANKGSIPALDMTGTLSYSPGINTLTGILYATGLSGNATGRFFGPTANEIGGTFYLTGAGGNFIGAFGGK